MQRPESIEDTDRKEERKAERERNKIEEYDERWEKEKK